jgi:uncharacterized membrane protein
MNGADFREYFTDAIRFWEPRRVLYNLALAVIVVAYFFAGYPSSKVVLSIDFALGLFMLAVVANIAYCAAYGALFAAIITRFIAMGMFHLAD